MTLLRMLATLIPPDAGSATIDKFDVVRSLSGPRRHRRAVGRARAVRAVTARQNVRYYGWLHGLAAPVLDTRIDQLFAGLAL
jgi:sodium transport system ATP-binding protein